MGDLEPVDYGLGLVAFFVLFGCLYGTYYTGRRLERRDLTLALIKSIQATYDDGKTDGLKEGYKQGLKYGLKSCDMEMKDIEGRY